MIPDVRSRPHIGEEQGELHRLLVEGVSDYAIFALDPNGYVLSWNAGAQRFKGYTAHEVIGQHFSIFYPTHLVEQGFPEFELKTAASTGRFEDEGWRVRKDGTRFWANVVITALKNETGALLGFAKVTRDLTSRRAAELALQESEERFRLLVEGVKDYALFMLVRSASRGTKRARSSDGIFHCSIPRRTSTRRSPRGSSRSRCAWVRMRKKAGASGRMARKSGRASSLRRFATRRVSWWDTRR